MSEEGGNILQWIFTGDASGIIAATERVHSAFEKVGEGAKGVGEHMEGAFEKAKEVATEFIAPILAAATAWMTFEGIVQAFERNNELGKVAGQLGTTVDSLSKLQYAANASEVSTEEVNGALHKMTMVLGQAAQGAAPAVKALEQLHMKADDFVGLSADQAFLKISDALNHIESSGKRAAIGQELYGRGAASVVAFSSKGAAAIREMGDEGERLGRVTSAVDFGQMKAATETVAHLKTAFTALADQLAVKLAPAIDYVAELIDDWVGNTNQFGDAFQSVANGIVDAIVIVRGTWQGLEMLWEVAKVTIGELSVIGWEWARDYVKAILFVWGELENVYGLITAGFKVVAAEFMVGWEAIKFAGIKSFAYLEDAFGKMIRSMGEAAGASGLDLLGDVATKTANAGAALEVAAAKMKTVSSGDLKAAVTGLKNAAGESLDAVKKFGEMPDTATPYFDNMVANAQNFRDKSVGAIQDLAYTIASTSNGNAFENLFKGYGDHVAKFQARATQLAKEGSEARAVITKEETDHNAQVWEKFWADHAKAKQAFDDRMLVLNSSDAKVIAARQQEYNDNLVLKDKEAQDAMAMQWESGMRGKLEITDSILSTLSTLMQSKNREMFEAGKAAAISDAIIQTWLGAQKAYTSLAGIPVVGPALGAAAAAAAVLAGMVRVQNIQSTHFGGGGSGSSGGGGGGGASAGASPAAPASVNQTTVAVQLVGQGGYTDNQIRSLVGLINQQAGQNLVVKMA